MNDERVKGLIVIFTGDGWGKSFAALGVVCRTLGHGFKCKIIQFVCGMTDTVERSLAERLAPDLQIERAGAGGATDEKERRQAALTGLDKAKEAFASGKFKTVVLDEIFEAVGAGLVSVEQVEEIIGLKPDGVHLLLTGRGAPDRLIEKADMVTNMRAVKRPSRVGVTA